MEILSMQRAAHFKYEGRIILILKISLPRIPCDENGEFSERFNAFYAAACRAYCALGERLADEVGARAAARVGGECRRPYHAYVTWEMLDSGEGGTLRIRRTLTLPEGVRERGALSSVDAFMPERGLLIKEKEKRRPKRLKKQKEAPPKAVEKNNKK